MNIANVSSTEIADAVSHFLQPGDVAEFRVPKTRSDGTVSGYFSDPAKLSAAAKMLDGKAAGLYLTLNPVNPALLSRADNRTKSRAEQTTSDSDIAVRRWMLFDLDAKRPAGISSSDIEHRAALQRAIQIRSDLSAAEWPDPIYADSGNGAHLVYRLPDLPNDDGSTALIKACLQAAAKRYDDAVCQVDQTVFNAARIMKVYGTLAAKGDSTAERPHRRAAIIEAPEPVLPVSVELLRALAAEVAVQGKQTAATGERPHVAGDFNIERWMAQYGLLSRGPEPYRGGQKWTLHSCPFNPDHKAPDAAIFQGGEGRLGFKCLHNSCAGKDWKALRDHFEPSRERNVSQDAHNQASSQTRATPVGLTDKSAFEIYNGDYQEPESIIEKLLFSGLTILAARPKTGKSWWALQIAIAIANGTPLGGRLKVNKPGRVLYVALEESERRTAPRLRMLTGCSDFLEDIRIVYDISSLSGGGVGQIDAYLTEHPCVLVVIDTFFAFSRNSDRKQVDILQNDYNCINIMRQLAEKHNCAILLVHHTRKAAGESIDTVLGTSGVTAACDAIWTLRKQVEGDSLLTVTGREMEETVYGMRMETGEPFGWRIVSKGAEAELSAERRQIVDLLRSEGPQVPKAISAMLKKNPTTVRRLLQMLGQDGLITKNGETYSAVSEA